MAGLYLFMAIELELRFLDIDVVEITNKLEMLGAKKVGDWLQERFVFQFKDKKKGEQRWIRVRTNGEKTTIAYKHILKNTIDGTEEVEFEVSDMNAAMEFLEKCGFLKEGPQQNKRITYLLDDVEIDIDTWPDCPPWLEIEAKNEDEIKKICKKLNLDFSKGTAAGVLDILVGYGYDRKQKVCKF